VTAGIVPKWLTLGNGLTVAVIAPALVWSFLSLVLTLGLGHPSMSTVEVPYIELAIQVTLAGGVFLLMSRKDQKCWLIILLPLILWVIIRGLISGISPLWIFAISLLLLSPIISLLLAGHSALGNLRALKWSFTIIVVGQLVTFPFNFLSVMMDDDASVYDRFSGTLLGKGGYFSSYILLAATSFLLVSRAKLKVKLAAVVIMFTYAWFAEVKLIWFVAGAVVFGMLIMTTNRKNLLWKVPLAVGSLAIGAILSILVPSSLGLHSGNLNFSVGAPSTFGNLTQDGSKVTVIQEVLNPWSDLWAENNETAIVGVGPAGGLSHMSRTADAQGLFVSQIRPDSEFRDSARLLAGSQQQDQSLATQAETTILGIVSEVGYLGLILFLISLVLVFRILLKKFDRSTVGIVLGFVIAFVPLFSLWEVPGFWIVLALGLAAYGQRLESIKPTNSA